MAIIDGAVDVVYTECGHCIIEESGRPEYKGGVYAKSDSRGFFFCPAFDLSVGWEIK